MKTLFNPESPLMQMLAKVADMIIVNLLLMVCSLPVFTAGAALCAAHKVMQNIVLDEETSVVKPFFKAFKDNFKQATVVWLVLLVLAAGLVVDFKIVHTYLEGGAQTIAFVILAVLSVTVAGVATILFPLMTRYANTLKQHVFNALILAICHAPRTICMVILHAAPFLLLIFNPISFLETLVFWIMLGICLVIFLDNLLLKTVYEKLEKSPEDEEAAAEEAEEV